MCRLTFFNCWSGTFVATRNFFDCACGPFGNLAHATATATATAATAATAFAGFGGFNCLLGALFCFSNTFSCFTLANIFSWLRNNTLCPFSSIGSWLKVSHSSRWNSGYCGKTLRTINRIGTKHKFGVFVHRS